MMPLQPDQKSAPSDRAATKVYSSPRLTVYGTIANLTQANAMVTNANDGMMDKTA